MGTMIFFDTGAWIALAVPGDRNAPAAKSVQSDVTRGRHGAIVTTSSVLDEAATLVRMETDVPAAARFFRSVLEAPSVMIVWVVEAHVRSALDLFERHRDKRWSFTDCTSFVIMRELGVEEAFTFDHNFVEAGFRPLP